MTYFHAHYGTRKGVLPSRKAIPSAKSLQLNAICEVFRSDAPLWGYMGPTAPRTRPGVRPVFRVKARVAERDLSFLQGGPRPGAVRHGRRSSSAPRTDRRRRRAWRVLYGGDCS